MRILINGVASPLGLESARVLSEHGAQLIGVDADLQTARDTTADITSLELIEADPASLTSVRACTDDLNHEGSMLDLIICTGGIVACPQGQTQDGFETQFAINYLSQFLLVNRLAPLLRAGSRVVMVSSAGHRFADVNLDDPNFEHTAYDPWTAYGRSSTAKILFALEFDRRHRDRGVRAASVHPGAVRTALSQHVSADVVESFARPTPPGATQPDPAQPTAPMQWKTLSQSIATTLWVGLVADADAIGGRYCEDCQVAPAVNDREARSGVQSFALDPARAQALWTVSETLVDERF
jgi:NAD(P)-dependent dehydrogenase (short-subunit alcohol dehydrogenase family)